MLETAHFMYWDTPLLELTYEDGKLIKSVDLGVRTNIPHVDMILDLPLRSLGLYLLSRIHSSGRLNRSEVFEGQYLTTFEELKFYGGADLDDNCYVRFDWFPYTSHDLFDLPSSTNRVSSSPKGNQPKWETGTKFYKQDNFPNESLAEYLISLFLESSNCPVPFIPYRLETRDICSSPNYKPRYLMFPFAQMLTFELTFDESNQKVGKGSPTFNSWYKRVWSRLSAEGRVNYLVELFAKYGVPKEESLAYLTAMVELDTLVFNTDRHFNNFGLMYDLEEQRYKPMFLFDQGFSLAVGEGIFGSVRKLTDPYRVKMQPFSTTLSKNRRALPDFKFEFDVLKFILLLDETNILTKEELKETTQFRILKRRLATEYQTDVHGRDILKTLISCGY